MINDFEVALPRLSVENRLRDLQYELRASAAFIAALGGIQPTTLSNAYRGIKSLPNETGQELLATVTYLMAVAESLRPFRLDMSNATETRALLDRLRKNNVSPESVREGVAKILAGNEG